MLITRCPECATLFRCHPEQLNQARGWVRCGRCSAVFEALQHAKAESSLADWTDLATSLEPDRRTAGDRTGHAPARWPRWALTFTASLLFLLLPAQWLIGQRDLLAAQSPIWRGLWLEGCRWLGCEVAWPRVPQALRMESVRVEPDASGLYEVQLQIRNTAMHPVAAPWVDLSLTGLRDEVLVRRALAPQDIGLTAPVLALRDATAVFRFQWVGDVALPVTGYKAILFYP